MKHIAIIFGITLVTFTVVFLLFYMAGSFAFASFDLQKWTPYGRAFIAFVAAILACVISGLSIVQYNEDLNKKKS